MKNNKQVRQDNPRSSNTNKNANNSGPAKSKADAKTAAVTSATNITRTRHKVGHGLANEGTNVSYEEER